MMVLNAAMIPHKQLTTIFLGAPIEQLNHTAIKFHRDKHLFLGAPIELCCDGPTHRQASFGK